MKLQIGILMAGLVLAGCGGSFEEGYEDGKDAATEVVEESVVEESHEVVEESPEDEVEVEEVEYEPKDIEDEEVPRDVAIGLAEMIMVDNLGELGEVRYDVSNDALTFMPTDPQFSQELSSMVLGLSDRDEWDGMVDSFKGLSESISMLVDEDIGLAILNPDNADNVLVLIRDGEIFYDFMDEME